MLEVYIDKFGIHTNTDYLINDHKDFVLQWEDIIKWTNDGDMKIIAVRKSHLENLFKNLKDVFGNKIKIAHISPKAVWEELFKVNLNSDISDEELAELIKKGIFPKTKQTPLTETLLYLAGNKELHESDLAKKLMECILNNAEERYPLTLQQAIAEFSATKPLGKRELWQFISDSNNKKQTLQKLIMTHVSKSYPPNSIVYKNYYLPSFDYKFTVFDSSLTEYLPVEFKEIVKSYLSSLKDFSEVAQSISGMLKEEWDTILELLNNNPIQNEIVIAELFDKAKNFSVVKSELLKFKPVNPPKEITLRADNSIFEWLKDYFEYYKYSRLINQPMLTEKYAIQFEEFLCNLYLQKTEWILNNSILSIKEIIDSYIKIRRPALLLVVDGMGCEYVEELRNIFRTDIKMLFSSPPTKTRENKQRILSGLMDTNIDYTNILIENYKDTKWKEADSKTLPLSEFLKENLDLYIYWENQFDSLIHNEATYKKRFFDHKTMVKQIKEEIKDFIERGGIVIITGDHGFTILPYNADKCVSLPEQAIESHRRIAYCEEVDSTTQEKCHLYDKILIAKGYYYFNAYPKGGTHGGLTPEEAVVPLLIIDKQPESIFPLEFKLQNISYYRKQVIQTKLIVYNPNPFNLVIEDINISPSICSILDIAPVIYAKQPTNVDIELNLKDINQETVALNIKYVINKTEFTAQIIFETKGAMVEKDFDWD